MKKSRCLNKGIVTIEILDIKNGLNINPHNERYVALVVPRENQLNNKYTTKLDYLNTYKNEKRLGLEEIEDHYFILGARTAYEHSTQQYQFLCNFELELQRLNIKPHQIGCLVGAFLQCDLIKNIDDDYYFYSGDIENFKIII
jgi:hypothetical protein